MTSNSSLPYDVFLSHNNAQKDWARGLVAKLREAGLSVFFDEDSIQLGDDISVKIEFGLRHSRHVLLVLSPQALRSKWVALELSMSLYRDPDAASRTIIPILREDCEMPLTLARLKYLDARSEETFTANFSILLSAIRHETELGQPTIITAERPVDSLPQVVECTADFHAGGALPSRCKSYISRPEDAQLESVLAGPNGLAVLWGPRMIGKSSMAVRALDHMANRGYATAYIDFGAFGRLPTRELFAAIAWYISDRLKIDAAGSSINHFSDVGIGSFLTKISSPTVLAFDEIDILQEGSERSQFFAALRAFHHHQSIYRSRVHILISSFVPPSSFITSFDSSPFNVGQHIRLQGFDRHQIRSLLERTGHIVTDTELSEVYTLTGGQPYLTQQLAMAFQSCGSIGGAIRLLKEDAARGSVHLDFTTRAIEASNSGQRGVRKLLQGRTLEDEEIAVLDQLGVIRKTLRGPIFLNELYRLHFSKFYTGGSIISTIWSKLAGG